LATIFRENNFFKIKPEDKKKLFINYSLNNFFQSSTHFFWRWDEHSQFIELRHDLSRYALSPGDSTPTKRLVQTNPGNNLTQEYEAIRKRLEGLGDLINVLGNDDDETAAALNILDELESMVVDMSNNLTTSRPTYFSSNRSIVPAMEYSWAGFLRDDIGLPKEILSFANKFSLSRKNITELDVPFLKIKYLHLNGQDFIKIPESESLFRFHEIASGVQSTVPLLVLIEQLINDTESIQNFIIEEPELNLYPTAQQGLLNWLVEKCTKGENDLTITTHSPYLLAHFNTLLFAHQVAQNHPERANEIAKIVPRESWIDPKEFAAYHVEGQKENGVRSIVNSETGLISYNGLDAIASAEATEFEKLLDINAGLEVEW
jgi:hypothetical protein